MLPQHLGPATGREIFLYVDVANERRCMKWIGKCERCQLNGEAVALNEERQLSQGDDLEV